MAKQTKKRFRKSKRKLKRTNIKSRKNCMRGGYRGTINYMNGTYTGEIWKNKPHGFGKIEWADDEKTSYEGEWIEGKMFGRGTMKFQNGIIYDGRWKNNMKHGFGSMHYNNGKVAEGYWKSDNPIGQFKIIYNILPRDNMLPHYTIINADKLDDFEVDDGVSEATTNEPPSDNDE